MALHRSHQGHDQPDFRPGILMAINREFIAHMDRAFKEAEDSDRQTAEQLCASNTGSFIELIAELEALLPCEDLEGCCECGVEQ